MQCIEPPKILVVGMEWAFFFVGDMERENIVVTMEWGDGLHSVGVA